MPTRTDFEIMVIDIIRDRPASAETISRITGLPTNYVLMKLNKMKKWKEIEPVTKKECIIWGIPRVNCVKTGKR